MGDVQERARCSALLFASPSRRGNARARGATGNSEVACGRLMTTAGIAMETLHRRGQFAVQLGLGVPRHEGVLPQGWDSQVAQCRAPAMGLHMIPESIKGA